MKYYHINTLPRFHDSGHACLDTPPDTVCKTPDDYMARIFRDMRLGESVAARFPCDVSWQMDRKQSHGNKLGSLVANTNSLLIVELRLAEVFKKFDESQEIFSISILDHKGRLASEDYRIVHPLTIFDCLNFDHSKLLFSSITPGKIIEVKTPVLSKKKLQAAPDIFRIERMKNFMVFSERIVEKINALIPAPTCLKISEVSQAD